MRTPKRYSVKVDKGKVREKNEDRGYIVVNSRGDVLMVVADGMGGYDGGEIAAQLACDTLIETFRAKSRFFTTLSAKRWLRKTIRKANTRIFKHAKETNIKGGMGTTLTCALILKNSIIIANVGDSRAYKFEKSEGLTLLSEDQTYVDYLIKSGHISEEERSSDSRRHILTNALGLHAKTPIEINHYLYKNETILLCSDGLYHRITTSQISNILSTNDAVEQKVATLVVLANENGGDDNIAVALLEADV